MLIQRGNIYREVDESKLRAYQEKGYTPVPKPVKPAGRSGAKPPPKE